MYYHYQNLTEPCLHITKPPYSRWKTGRAWLSSRVGDNFGRTLHWEWGFFNYSRLCYMKINFGTGDGNDAISLCLSIPYLFYIYISLDKLIRCKECETGVSIFDDSISFSILSYSNEWNSKDVWYRKSKYFEFPYKYVWYKSEVLSLDRKYVVFERRSNKLHNTNDFINELEIEKTVSATYPYKYVRENGDIQNVNARVHVSRTTHRRKWFKWIKRQWTFIDVNFDNQIGEKVDTWKGGVLGCSYILRDDETPEQCLRRMEIERKF